MRILLIVPPERFDFYSYLSAAKDVEWILLWHEKPGQMKLRIQDLPLSFSSIAYWTDFRSPAKLIESLQPDRIVFFEIIDLRQIALIVAAKKKNVPTFYLEHGAAGDKETAVQRWNEITFKGHKLPYLWKRFRNSFGDILKSKLFYYSVTGGFRSPKAYGKYFSLSFKMLRGAPMEVLNRNLFRERVPDRSIVFNEANFQEYVLHTGIDREEAIFTGVPFFDSYYRGELKEEDYVVYIDHPYYEEKLEGWTKAHFDKVAKTLLEFAESRKVLLYVKLHPRSSKTLWQELLHDSPYIRIIQTGDFMDLYLRSSLILGFSSSLITGFLCARKNVVLLGWHPEPHIFGADFSQTGLCHVSFSPDELSGRFDMWRQHNLTLENEAAYESFLHQFNYPFDGKATERVIKVITGNEAP